MMINNIWLFDITIWRLIENFLNSSFELKHGRRVLLVFCFISNMKRHSFVADCVRNFLKAYSTMTIHVLSLEFLFFPKQCWKSSVPPTWSQQRYNLLALLQLSEIYFKIPILYCRCQPFRWNFFVVCFGWNRKSILFSFFVFFF